VKRLVIGAVSAVTLAAFSLQSATALATDQSEYGSGGPFCSQQPFSCTELNQYIKGYTGHDEPSLLFYSNPASAPLRYAVYVRYRSMTK